MHLPCTPQVPVDTIANTIVAGFNNNNNNSANAAPDTEPAEFSTCAHPEVLFLHNSFVTNFQ